MRGYSQDARRILYGVFREDASGDSGDSDDSDNQCGNSNEDESHQYADDASELVHSIQLDDGSPSDDPPDDEDEPTCSSGKPAIELVCRYNRVSPVNRRIGIKDRRHQLRVDLSLGGWLGG